MTNTTATNIDLARIRTDNGSQSNAFEELCCQLARRDSRVAEQEVPSSSFMRIRGAGGDGGVECLWTFTPEDGQTFKWGWQSKFFWELDKKQMEKSVRSAITNHPELTRYVFCLPFDLTGKRQGPGTSDTEKLETYKKEWQKIASDNGAEVEFEIWSRSELIDKLIAIDSSGGIRRYWFDEQFLSRSWFRQQLDTALKTAEPRYTPYLRVDVPIFDTFEAFGQNPDWFDRIRLLSRQLIKAIRYWSVPSKQKDHIDYPKPAIELAVKVRAGIESILNELADLEAERLLTTFDVQAFSKLANETLGMAESCLLICIDEVESKHGSGTAKSPRFKQFMAEINAELPARHVDQTEEIVDALRSCTQWIENELSIACDRTLLLLGSAGSGKTHAFCDLADMRFAEGLLSLCLFGHQFGSATIWETIRSRVGLSAGLGREELLSALNVAAETSGHPLVIFIDALNETSVRDFWQDNLVEFVQQVQSYDHLKLAVSCRTSYRTQVIPATLRASVAYHNGFGGVELDACNAFFKYYGLGSPQLPMLQPEFSNPLFLRLLCETLQAEGVQSFPDDIIGIGDLVDRFVRLKNERIAKLLDIDPKEKVVQAAIENLVQELINEESESLEWTRAKELVDNVRPGKTISDSLFHFLLKEELLFEDSVTLPNKDSVDKVWFGFQRLSDHLIAKHTLEQFATADAFQAELSEDTWLRKLFDATETSSFALGVIEALSCEVPRCFGTNLLQILPSELLHDLQLWEIFIRSLPWQQPKTLTKQIVEVIEERFTDRWLTQDVLEVLLSLAPFPSHPLGAHWLHSQLLTLPMNNRDGLLSAKLRVSWDEGGVVDGLIHWTFCADLSNLKQENVLAWSIALSWYCLSADRQIRDHATKAIVRLLSANPGSTKGLLDAFVDVDDDYVLERVIASVYGSLLRSKDESAMRETAEFLLDRFFQKERVHINVQVRDYARLIVQLAVDKKVIVGVDASQYCPPYQSEWPLEFPTDQWIAQYKNSDRELPGIYQSLFGFPADFGRYTLGSALSEFPAFDKRSAMGWILKEVLDLGYPGTGTREYDLFTLNKFGHGRNKPVWAERIGKKYQWIALARLLGHLSDHVEPQTELETHDASIWLPGQRLRDLDVSLLKRSELVGESGWWFSGYANEELTAGDDVSWLRSTRMPNGPGLLVDNPAGELQYLILALSHSWDSKPQEDRVSKDDYRSLKTYVNSYFIPVAQSKAAWKYLKCRYYKHGMFPDNFDFYDTFLGEYPFAAPYQTWFRLLEQDPYQYSAPFELIPASHDLSCHYEYDGFSDEKRIEVDLPSQLFFQENDLTWDGLGSYLNQEGTRAFLCPTFYEPGPRALLAEKEHLTAFLDRHELALVIVELHTKYASAQPNIGPNDGTRFHLFSNGTLQSEPGACFGLTPMDMYPEMRTPAKKKAK